VNGGILHRTPVEWLLCGVVMSNVATSKKFRTSAVVQFVGVPMDYISGPHVKRLGHGVGATIWDAPATVDDAQVTMSELAALIRDEAIPYLDQLGTLPAFAADAQLRAEREPTNLHYQEALFAVRLITGDTPGALQVAASIKPVLAEADAPWEISLGARVAEAAEAARHDPARAVDLLRSHAVHTLAALGLTKAT
jgi:hypothetical protein